MNRKMCVVLLCLVVSSGAYSGESKLLSWWKFDEGQGDELLDSASGVEDDIEGIYTFVDGVSGKCLKLDGYTGRVERKGQDAPEFGDSFTIEAWVAAQTYPWNWTGIVEQGCKSPLEKKQTDEPEVEALKMEQGLYGVEFNNPRLESVEGTNLLKSADNDWTGQANDWAGQWKGYILSPYTGVVNLEARSDNGLRLEIDGKMVIDGWGQGKARKGQFEMVKAKRYPITVTYFQDGGDAVLKLFWSWQGKDKTIITSKALMHSENEVVWAKSVTGQAEQQDTSGIVPRVSLAIDAEGHLIFGGLIGGRWQQCRSEKKIELLKWNHIAGSFDRDGFLAVYINGIKVGSVNVKGRLYEDSSGTLFIGKGVRNMSPVGTERDASRKTLSMMVFDGLVDEVKIYDKALSESEMSLGYEKAKPAKLETLKYRQMPKGPERQAGNFGAVYCRLLYDDLWEEPWRVGGYSDILVRFDESPVRVAFWRGTSFGASWITENDIWMGDQSLEDSGTGWGLSEHMADKQCRYSHVRLVENNDARVVVHWRYAVSDIRYTINHADEETGWGDWADEYHYIYPDAVGTRKQILWSGANGGFQWQETIVFNQPGTHPEDNIELEALTIANIEGQSRTYSWAGGSPEDFDGPENADIQLTNLKSRYKPFIVFDNDGGEIKAFGDGHELSVFPWWNHWPAGMIPSDGREVRDSDRPSHSSLSYRKPNAIRGKGDSAVAVRLCGMTDKGIEYAVKLARSWQRAPELRITSRGFESKGYDKFQRAYVIERKSSESDKIDLTISASKERPIVNPAFVIRNWGLFKPVLKIDGRQINDPKVFRFGYNRTISSNDMIIWLKLEAEKTVKFEIR